MSQYKNITNLLDLFCSALYVYRGSCKISMRTFVLANTCSVGEKAKIVRFICKNNVFKILFIKVYHFHPPHYTTTYHYHNPTSPKTNSHNKITPSTTPLYLPTIPPYKTIKPTYPPSTTTHTHQKNLQNKTLHSTKTKNFQN